MNGDAKTEVLVEYYDYKYYAKIRHLTTAAFSDENGDFNSTISFLCICL